MPAKTIPIHGKDHLPNGSDPIPGIQVSGGAAPAGNWHDVVTGYGPHFWWYFQDDLSDGVFTDISGHGWNLAPPSTVHFFRDPTVWYFNDQAYSGTGDGTTARAVANVGVAGTHWASGQGAPFSLEIWFRRVSNTNQRGAMFANQAPVDAAGYWGVRFDANGKLFLTRYGANAFTTITPPFNEWHQYVVTGDGTHARLYYDGVLVASLLDPAQTTDQYVFINGEETATLYYLTGNYAAIVGYDTALTDSQVAGLFNAGVASAASGVAPTPPADIGNGLVQTWQIKPGSNNTWLHTTPAGAVSWDTLPASGALPADVVVAAATRIIASFLAAGDTQPAWRVLGNGQQDFGVGGTTAPDVSLFRDVVGGLAVSGRLVSYRTNAATAAFGSLAATTDTQFRWYVRGDGQMNWGLGGTTAPDTSLYRQGAGLLKTDGDMIFAGGDLYLGVSDGTDVHLYRSAANTLRVDGAMVIAGNICVGGIVAAAVGGAQANKLPVYNTAGTLVGYVPIYAT